MIQKTKKPKKAAAAGTSDTGGVVAKVSQLLLSKYVTSSLTALRAFEKKPPAPRPARKPKETVQEDPEEEEEEEEADGEGDNDEDSKDEEYEQVRWAGLSS